ncbi:hypothetical protein QBC40DRAFT_271749 [Triangularia verruculosa]|uniref:RxLR effector protein n=1 Tax=Triangularia verruculosa TaxID=2587418 RepID=A0AAN6XV54_9PEZI|nr:hypothetical protein QBC40DRAFT_271749 [Triangularia verruculosa]
MKFSPALLLLSATSPLALAIASPQDNPGVPAPSGSGTPLARRQVPSNGSNIDNTVINSRQRRALLRMRQEEATSETAVTTATESAPEASETAVATATESAPAATEVPDDGDVPDETVEAPDLANGTLPVNGTAPGNGTTNGTLSEQELKMRRMVKIKLPDYRRDEGVKERDVEAELGLTASIAKLLRW